MPTLEQVFGVTSTQVLSYVERNDVDDSFRTALNSGKQIVVYGSSKQGKTALVSKYLPYKENLLVSLTPRTKLIDIYQTILSNAGVKIQTSTTEKSATESGVAVSTKVKAFIPLFGAGEAGVDGNTKAGSAAEVKYEEVAVNVELPQSIATMLERVGNKRWVILENFHYLDDEVQKQFAFDLRAYQELGVRFVILGVWREKNRMAQFNGDLLDRTVEVPVEPWREEDFRRVVVKGATELNITIAPDIVTAAVEASFSSIGVFQELIKHICKNAGIVDTQSFCLNIFESRYLQAAIHTKAADYAARHERALEAIAAGHTSGGAKSDLQPLFLPYYLVRAIIERGFDGIANGSNRASIHEWIKTIHHRGEDVRAGDMTNLLDGLAHLQSVRGCKEFCVD